VKHSKEKRYLGGRPSSSVEFYSEWISGDSNEQRCSTHLGHLPHDEQILFLNVLSGDEDAEALHSARCANGFVLATLQLTLPPHDDVVAICVLNMLKLEGDMWGIRALIR
jgi:hypothetical protein